MSEGESNDEGFGGDRLGALRVGDRGTREVVQGSIESFLSPSLLLLFPSLPLLSVPLFSLLPSLSVSLSLCLSVSFHFFFSSHWIMYSVQGKSEVRLHLSSFPSRITLIAPRGSVQLPFQRHSVSPSDEQFREEHPACSRLLLFVRFSTG